MKNLLAVLALLAIGVSAHSQIVWQDEHEVKDPSCQIATTSTTKKVITAKLSRDATAAQAPTAPTSLVTETSTQVGLIGAVNGKGQASMGALIKLFSLSSFPKVSAYAFTGVGIGQKNTPVWAGAALGYDLYVHGLTSLTVGAGWQGLNVTTGQVANGIANGFVFVSLKLGIKQASTQTPGS